ncbi:ankyrin repeat containing protein [Coccidioides posadasii C735 delta SOWgp]|uniref:Ankyrin repeat containing protein n=1 Tax=Coccidioides posadasii (strain C735) TaxID=222929 RepID=C5P6G0_COCP7|nr:ankyrin repeat containing protein [Coccidioides posadasii C735 delta SOWgp]EER27010.1 ankyrin repeat containing protein [Coccidioides posadasii C735 delta SOWgp]|eukprot:XP_003069155.1 ankyrin repeat containing protein [Coccidioides posadasii C735 delta SOWgp]
MPQPTGFAAWGITSHQAKLVSWFRLTREVRGMIINYPINCDGVDASSSFMSLVDGLTFWSTISAFFCVCRSWRGMATIVLLRSGVAKVMTVAPQWISEIALREFHSLHKRNLEQYPHDIPTLTTQFRTILDRLFIMALRRGFDGIVERLLYIGASPAVQDPEGESALYIATFNQSARCARVLLRHGAVVDEPARDQDGLRTSVEMAAINFDCEVMDLLIEYGANLNISLDTHGQTYHLVEWVVSMGHLEMLGLLISHGVLMWYLPDSYWEDLLVISVARRWPMMTRMLLDNGYPIAFFEKAVEDRVIWPTYSMRRVLSDYTVWNVLPISSREDPMPICPGFM